MRIVQLWRYPLKSARGEALTSARVETTGLAGDRVWACVDPSDGTVVSAKHPRRWGRLLEVGASLGHDDRLTVHVGGEALPAEHAEDALGAHLGRPVRLTREVPQEATLHRTLPGEPDLVPEWMAGIGAGRDAVTAVGGGGAGGFVDFAPVHVVTTGELARLGAKAGVEVAASRFRPNLVIDADHDWPEGAELRAGDVVLRTMLPTPRCAVPGLDHGPGVPADPAVLRTLARHYRIPVGDLGKAACFGRYAEVVEPGELRVGAEVS